MTSGRIDEPAESSCTKSGVFKLYLLKGHILMAEIFLGYIHVLQSKLCILLQDMPANISLHKHT
jgi:hypothetical protein